MARIRTFRLRLYGLLGYSENEAAALDESCCRSSPMGSGSS
jgi:hypothetical protein